MANLDLIKRLNEQYGKQSPIRSETKLFAINEAIDPNRLEKALPNSLATMGPLYAGYFDMGLRADVALLFIDVCSFSTRFSNLGGEEIADYFDKYYDVVIPLIYKYGGEIDKIIGDVIICIFGPPFLSNDIMIGKSLREIFRLESVSIDERINYYGDTAIRSFYEEIFGKRLSAGSTSTKVAWSHYDHRLPSLEGINFSVYHSIRHNK